MRIAFYVRVSTTHQQQAQTIEQQITQLRDFTATQPTWEIREEHIFRDDGVSGATLERPGLDDLRDQANRAAFDGVLITAPDRLARNLIHQLILLDELERTACWVQFLGRPVTSDPLEHVFVQMQGVFAEYERTLITDRLRRGRQAKLRAGRLLPWSRPPYGYRLDPERPRDPAGVQVDPVEAAVVEELYRAYGAGGATIHGLARRLTERQVPSPTGRAQWSTGSVFGILTNPSYQGEAISGRYQTVPANRPASPFRPAGSGRSNRRRPDDGDWIRVPVPAIITGEQFTRVQQRLATNRRDARRNMKGEYLLRGLVSCGHCQLSCRVHGPRPHEPTYRYYACWDKDPQRRASRPPCPARYRPAAVLDALVWADLVALLQHPDLVADALTRARSGAWVPDELRRRQQRVRAARGQLTRHRERLLEAYLAGVLDLATFTRKDRELDHRQTDLSAQERELAAQGQQLLDLAALTDSTTAIAGRLAVGLEQATFNQRRQLVELLIDRVIVTGDLVEIRYVFPTTDASLTTRFYHLHSDHIPYAGEGVVLSRVRMLSEQLVPAL